MEARAMAEHLPECPMKPIAEAPVDFYQVFPDCICGPLRACEERVQKIAYAPGLGAGSDEHGQHEIGWIKGYTAALSEVDEKVLRLQTHYSTLDGDTTVNRAEVLWITYCMRGEDQ